MAYLMLFLFFSLEEHCFSLCILVLRSYVSLRKKGWKIHEASQVFAITLILSFDYSSFFFLVRDNTK